MGVGILVAGDVVVGEVVLGEVVLGDVVVGKEMTGVEIVLGNGDGVGEVTVPPLPRTVPGPVVPPLKSLVVAVGDADGFGDALEDGPPSENSPIRKPEPSLHPAKTKTISNRQINFAKVILRCVPIELGTMQAADQRL